VAVSDLRRFLTKYNRAREHFHRGNFQACQMNLGEAIKNRLKGQFLKADRELIDQDLFTLVSQVTAHKFFKETYGPVTIVEGQMEQWLALFDQVVFLESEIYDRLNEAQEKLDARQTEAARQLFDKILADYADDPGMAIDIGDRYMDRRLYADAEKAYRRAVGLMEGKPDIPAALLADTKQKAGRSNARYTMTAFWSSIRDRPFQEKSERLAAKLNEIYRFGREVRWTDIREEKNGLITLDLRVGGQQLAWVDPLEVLPLWKLDLTGSAVTDLTPLKGLPLTWLSLGYNDKISDLRPLRGLPL